MDISKDDTREIDSMGKPILTKDEKKEIADKQFDENRQENGKRKITKIS